MSGRRRYTRPSRRSRGNRLRRYLIDNRMSRLQAHPVTHPEQLLGDNINALRELPPSFGKSKIAADLQRGCIRLQPPGLGRHPLAARILIISCR
jgi:hypothetical protein